MGAVVDVVVVVGTAVDVVLVVGTAVDVVLVVGTAVDVVLVMGAAVVEGFAVVAGTTGVVVVEVDDVEVDEDEVDEVVEGTAGVVTAVAPLAVQTIDGFDHCIARSGVGQPRLPSHAHMLAPSAASPPPPCALVNPAAHTYLAFAPDGCFLDASAIEASWSVTPVPAVCGAWPHMSGVSAFLILKSTCPA